MNGWYRFPFFLSDTPFLHHFHLDCPFKFSSTINCLLMMQAGWWGRDLRWGHRGVSERLYRSGAPLGPAPASPYCQGWVLPGLLTITVVPGLERRRWLQAASQGPIATVAVVEASIDVDGVLRVGRSWQ